MNEDLGQSLKSEHLNLEELIYSQGKEIEELKIIILEIRALLKEKEEQSSQQEDSKSDLSSSATITDQNTMNPSSKTLQKSHEVHAYTEENRSFIHSIYKRKK